MGRLILSLNNPLFELPHRVGLQGIAKLLDYCDRTQCLTDLPIKWDILSTQIDIIWDCDDVDFFTAIQGQAYQLKDGEIDSPCLELSSEERYFFSQGILNSCLQHNTHRKFTELKQDREFAIEGESVPIKKTTRELASYVNTSIPSNVFKKGKFLNQIPLKSNHLPGLIAEANGNGTYLGTVEEFLTLYFLPLATPIYPLPMDSGGSRVAVCFLDTRDLLDSLKMNILRAFMESTVTSASDACLRVLNKNLHLDVYNLTHEVFTLGAQPWNSRQKFLKQSVTRVFACPMALETYNTFLGLLSPQYRIKTIKDKEGERQQAFVSGSELLGYLAENLINGKPWHYKLGEYLFTEKYFEKETLIKMVKSHGDTDYKTFQGLIQSAYSEYMNKVVAKQFHRHYGKNRTKLIYSLNTPRNKRTFSKAFTQFLVISELINQDEKALELITDLIETDWHKAKDWALQAILLFVPPTTENPTGIINE